jgi:hypothetical protein
MGRYIKTPSGLACRNLKVGLAERGQRQAVGPLLGWIKFGTRFLCRSRLTHTTSNVMQSPRRDPRSSYVENKKRPLEQPDAAIRLIRTGRVRNDGAWSRLISLSLVLDAPRSPCTHMCTPGQRETLDLSSRYAAYNGAEPVRVHTLKRPGSKCRQVT